MPCKHPDDLLDLSWLRYHGHSRRRHHASQYVLQLRVEAARHLLERTDAGLKHVASSAGFGGVDVMRRAFVRLPGITPPATPRAR